MPRYAWQSTDPSGPHIMPYMFRSSFFQIVVTGLVVSIAQPSGAQSSGVPQIHNAQGEMSGEVTATSVLLQSRLTTLPGPQLDESGDLPGAVGVARFEYSLTPDFTDAQPTGWLTAKPETDFIVRAQLKNLQPSTQYFYRLISGRDKSTTTTGEIRSFKTLQTADGTKPVSFIMGSCQNYAFFMHGKKNNGPTNSEQDRKLGYPAYAAMTGLKPDFFIGTGDIVYYDHFKWETARTLPELRRKWHEQFRFPRMIEFLANTPGYWLKDDHDFRFNDADLNGDQLPTPETGIEIFREQMPIVAASDQESPTYRSHRINKHLQLWFVEGRDYRSDNRMKDGPDKTIWGIEQRDWLKKTLLESDATWKIIVTPTPMVGPDSKSKIDNHVNLNGFRYEADQFFDWLKANDQTDSVITFCGDRHWQYHSIHPSGVHEFSCGAINDENSIMGSFPGTKNSSDPKGLVKQPFHYKEVSGGFLRVQLDQQTSENASLGVQLYNDEGDLLYDYKAAKK